MASIFGLVPGVAYALGDKALEQIFVFLLGTAVFDLAILLALIYVTRGLSIKARIGSVITFFTIWFLIGYSVWSYYLLVRQDVQIAGTTEWWWMQALVYDFIPMAACGVGWIAGKGVNAWERKDNDAPRTRVTRTR